MAIKPVVLSMSIREGLHCSESSWSVSCAAPRWRACPIGLIPGLIGC